MLVTITWGNLKSLLGEVGSIWKLELGTGIATVILRFLCKGHKAKVRVI